MNSEAVFRVIRLVSPETTGAGIAPAFIGLWIVFWASGNRARWFPTISALGWGALSAIPVLVINAYLDRAIPDPDVRWLAGLRKAGIAGAVEESVRVSMIALLILRWRSFGIGAS